MSNKDHHHEKKGHGQPQTSHTEESVQQEEKKITHPAYEELEAKLNEAESKMNQYHDQLLRAQAETENVRRRAEKDISNAHKYGVEKLVESLLGVADGLELGLSKIPAEETTIIKSTHEGMTMTLGMLLKTLEKFGVKQIDPLGEPFNPTWHQALSTKEEPNAKPNTVVEVLQKGYGLQDRLLRPALVIVAK